MTPSRGEVTGMLAAIQRGDRAALTALVPLVYDELRKLADDKLRREPTNHTLQPTALVHEAYIRLVGQEDLDFNNRTHFFGAAAEVMRRILVDHARRRRAAKRGGDRLGEKLDEALVFFEERSADLLALDEALKRLAVLDPQQSRIVELRFFGGLSVDEAARVLDVSPSTVARGWRLARVWLLNELGE
ncbi:MAG: sigma-70 family RNA polymerase sigma factor [Planctomycetes bacterium]|nr:sigma-70 family RNA polymerase sigma factor [Planctomycetota bacterium]MBI3843910.1 sigma-70 family RNA polymerase sigma factor [Planctomycetota bacterium]